VIDERPEKISKALKSFVTTLAEIQEADLRSDLGTCNHYDLQVLQRALAILHSEVIKDDCWVKYQLRISARPISARPKEAKEAPKEAAPIAQQQPEDEVAKNEVFLEVLESQGVKDIENVQDVEDDVDDNGADNTSAGSAGNYEASVSPISEEKEGIIVATVL